MISIGGSGGSLSPNAYMITTHFYTYKGDTLLGWHGSRIRVVSKEMAFDAAL